MINTIHHNSAGSFEHSYQAMLLRFCSLCPEGRSVEAHMVFTFTLRRSWLIQLDACELFFSAHHFTLTAELTLYQSSHRAKLFSDRSVLTADYFSAFLPRLALFSATVCRQEDEWPMCFTPLVDLDTVRVKQAKDPTPGI